MKPLNTNKQYRETAAKNKRKQLFFVLRFFICIFAAAATLLAYIEKQNELTELRLAIPAITKEVKSLQEENIRLTYEIELFDSPIHLMELMRKPEFSHLKYPFLPDEVFLPQGHALFDRHNELHSEHSGES